jgi:hypothetical protein
LTQSLPGAREQVFASPVQSPSSREPLVLASAGAPSGMLGQPVQSPVVQPVRVVPAVVQMPGATPVQQVPGASAQTGGDERVVRPDVQELWERQRRAVAAAQREEEERAPVVDYVVGDELAPVQQGTFYRKRWM